MSEELGKVVLENIEPTGVVLARIRNLNKEYGKVGFCHYESLLGGMKVGQSFVIGNTSPGDSIVQKIRNKAKVFDYIMSFRSENGNVRAWRVK